MYAEAAAVTASRAPQSALVDERMDAVWNRAAMRARGVSPGPGDKALADLLLAHGLVMSGGVLYALESLAPSQLDAATEGFQYFGLPDAAQVLRIGRVASSTEPHSVDEGGQLERELDERYAQCVPTDGTLVQAFEKRFRADPTAFAPPED